MPLQPVERRSLGDQVFDQLCAQILHGELAAGENLPGERSLVDVLGVNRQAVREAIKRLEQAGLVEVHHGGRTTVTDWRRSAGLDLLPKLLVTADGAVDPAVVRSVMELRALVGPEVAARCTERMIPAIAAELSELAARYAAVDDATPLDELAVLDTAMWHALVDGSDNIAFRLAYNALRSEYVAAEVLLRELLAEELGAIELRARLLDRAIAGDAVHARAAAAELLAIGTAQITQALAGAPAAPAPTPEPPHETAPHGAAAARGTTA